MSDKIKILTHKKQRLSIAENNLFRFINLEWPIGSPIQWDHGGYTQFGRVKWVSRGGGGLVVLGVINNKTKKEIRIYHYQIIG